MKAYSCDFETATWFDNYTYVWAWAFCEIGKENNLKYGTDIKDFFNELLKEDNPICFFHNLKFDGEFIIYYLLKNGYEYTTRKEKKSKTFTTLISNLGMFYSIEVFEEVSKNKCKKITFYDSLKIINQRVEDISKSFKLDVKKLDLDYKKKRELNHVLTDEEIEYIKNDVIIVSKALNFLFSENQIRMTSASISLYEYRKILGNRFYSMFKPLSMLIDNDLRNAYKGGFTYLNPIYKNKITSQGYVLDVNSLYPSVMYNKILPYNEPVYYDGKYKEDKIYPLYIQKLTCCFELKKGKIPTIQIKKDSRYLENEYLKNSNGEIVMLTLTNIDLKLFIENYDIYDLEYINGYKFKAMQGLFSEYINKWMGVKEKATIEGNAGMRQVAKIFLNSLYGKFATSLKVRSKSPYLENEIVKYKLEDEEEIEGLYLPMSIFITAYAREITIRSSQKIKDYSIKKYKKDLYCYSDTDSIHTLLPLEDLKNLLNIDDVKLGFWKIENIFEKAKFIRQKCYIENIFDKKENNYKLKVTCAGLPDYLHSEVNFDNFEEGFTVFGKLKYKHVKGGIILKEEPFTVKKSKL